MKEALWWLSVGCILVAGVTLGRAIWGSYVSPECGWGFYSGIVEDCKECPELRPFVKEAFEDDKITISEYADLIREQDRIEKERENHVMKLFHYVDHTDNLHVTVFECRADNILNADIMFKAHLSYDPASRCAIGCWWEECREEVKEEEGGVIWVSVEHECLLGHYQQTSVRINQHPVTKLWSVCVNGDVRYTHIDTKDEALDKLDTHLGIST
jgi:hypothetical protein